ncbi:copper-transporting ATPase, partial [Pseudomonas syringae pv. tagetis]
ELALGNRRRLDESGLPRGELSESARIWDAEGRPLSGLIERAPETKVIGMFAFGATLKPGTARAIRSLNARGSSWIVLHGVNRGRAE